MDHNVWVNLLKERAKVSPSCMPNVFGVGAARCGTTSLYHIFNRSEFVYVPKIKELAYFSNHHRDEKNGSWYEEDYLAFFLGGEDKPYRADITPHYLHSERAMKRIRSASKDAKIIIQLRDPVERAISHYKHHYAAHGYKDINEYFSFGLKSYYDKEVGWVSWKHPLNNMRQSFYYDAVKSYVEEFGENNCHVIMQNNLSDNFAEVVGGLSDWLGTPLNVSEILRANSSSESESRVSEKIKKELYEIYAKDWHMVNKYIKDFDI